MGEVEILTTINHQQSKVFTEWAKDWRKTFPVSLKKWSVTQLSDALDDRTLKAAVRAEIDRRIALNKSTSLVVRMLLPKSIREADDAFKGLCKTCFRALGHLYFAPTRSDWAKDGDGLAKSKFDATKDFIERAIPVVLRPYFGKSEKQILTYALTGKFRHVPRAVKLDAVDALRSAYRRMDDGPEFLDLSFKVGMDDEGHPLTVEDVLARPEGKEDNSSLLSPPAAKARHMADGEILDKFLSARSRWIDLLGDVGWETLFAVVEEFTRGSADSHQREWKGKVSSAVAKKRGVSRVQAQADLRSLRAKMSAAFEKEQRDRHGVQLVTDIWELFSVPGDDLPGLGTYRQRKHSAGALLSPTGSE